MIPNRIKTLWAEGRPAINGWLSIGNAFSAEIMASAGYDSILTLGLTGRRYRAGFDREEPEMVEAIRHVLDVAHKAGIRAALHTGSAAYAAKAIGWGFDLVTVSNDVRLLAGAAEASVAEVRRLLGDRGPASAPAEAGGY